MLFMYLGKKNNSQSRGCQLPKPNKAQTTTASWQNPFRSNKNLGAESCSCFPWLHLVSVPASSSQGAVGCQICSRRAYSKMHVQPLCQDVDVPVMTKSSLRQQVYLTSFFMDDWWASHLSELHERLTAGLTVSSCPRFTVREFYCNLSNFLYLFLNY